MEILGIFPIHLLSVKSLLKHTSVSSDMTEQQIPIASFRSERRPKMLRPETETIRYGRLFAFCSRLSRSLLQQSPGWMVLRRF
jgi:hypothetical protein